MKDQLEEIDEQGYKWTGIKKLKGNCKPNFTKFKDRNGQRIPASMYAEKAAEYLANEQWKKQRDNTTTKKDKSPIVDQRPIHNQR